MVSAPLSKLERSSESKTEFIELYTDVRLSATLEKYHIPRIGFAIGIPIIFSMSFLLADTLSFIPIETSPFLVIILCYGIFIASVSTLYIDSALAKAIIEVGEVIDEENEYYEMMGDMIKSLYKPSWLFFALYMVILVCLLTAVSLSAERITLSLTTILVIFCSFLALILAGYSWGVLIFSIFFGWKIRKFTIYLDVTKTSNHLGLESYGKFIFRALLINLAGYTVVAGYILFLSTNPILIVFLIFGTGFAIIWFIGSQYGLHRAIVRSKENRLTELKKLYGDEIDQWFTTGEPNPEIENIDKTGEFLNVKKEIEEVPEWPSSNVQLVQVIGASVGANILAALPSLFL